jgi:hypothetical protein
MTRLGSVNYAVKGDTFLEAGKFGLWSKSDAQTYFDDLSVNGK